ncbi:hypothetical protein [Ensifer adhaerens]|uniref:hypothetical protein n=1 Tax=Ensifer adhaerens TaxID=106592 RepID=UPI0011773E40|nr:hypothetical protein [Ensifer adhaerens]
MMTLLQRLHSIAAQRGDGLRPELRRAFTPSWTWSEAERMDDTAAGENFGGNPADAKEEGSRSAQVVAMPQRKRNVRIPN